MENQSELSKIEERYLGSKLNLVFSSKWEIGKLSQAFKQNEADF